MKFKMLFVLLFVVACNQDPEIEPHVNDLLLVYPNPADTRVNISFSNPGSHPFTLLVFGADGEILFGKNESVTAPNYQLDLSGEPSGTYQAVLEIDNATITRKFLRR